MLRSARKLLLAATLLILAGQPVVTAASAPHGKGIAGPPGTETLPDEGRWHLEPGEKWEYEDTPPTSGPHDPKWITAGFYRTVQPPERLVHSLEHGCIVAYYDRPAADVLARLQGWAKRYRGKWDGVIVAPLPGLGKAIILTAWRKRLRLDPFDAARAQVFLDAFRGHGPESKEKMRERNHFH